MAPRNWLAPLLVSLGLLGFFVVRHHGCLYDDAFIYLRYVQNWQAGCGLRFNCADAPVEGFSSPLLMGLLLAGSIFTGDLVTLSQVVSTGVLALVLGATVIAASREGTRAGKVVAPGLLVAAGVAAALSLDHFTLLNSVIGLDAGVGALLVVVTFSAIDAGRPRLAAAAAVVAFTARPEGILLVAALLLTRETRRAPIFASALAGVAAVTLGRWLVFHDVLPNTYYAKSGGTAQHLRLGLAYLGDLASDFPVVLLAPLAWLDRERRASTRHGLAIVAVWLVFFLRSGGDTFAYSRLAFPVVPLCTLLAARGLVALSTSIAKGSAGRWSAVGLPLLAVGARAAVVHDLPEQHGFPNVEGWASVGRWIGVHHPGALIATVPIGAISFYSRSPVLDLVGLTEPAIAKAGRTVPPERLDRAWIGHERHNLEYVVGRSPDLIVMSRPRDRRWEKLEETTGGFYADWLLLRGIKEGRLPYRIEDAETEPGVHWLLFAKVPPEAP